MQVNTIFFLLYILGLQVLLVNSLLEFFILVIIPFSIIHNTKVFWVEKLQVLTEHLRSNKRVGHLWRQGQMKGGTKF